MVSVVFACAITDPEKVRAKAKIAASILFISSPTVESISFYSKTL
jgi:hypothetical protein